MKRAPIESRDSLTIRVSLRCNTKTTIVHLFHSHGEVQNLVVLEVLQSVVLDDRYSHIRVAERLDAVPNPHDELVLLPHALHVIGGVDSLIGTL